METASPRNELPATGDFSEKMLAREGPQRPPGQLCTQSRDPSSDSLPGCLGSLPGGHRAKHLASAAKTRAQERLAPSARPVHRRTDTKTSCFGDP